MLTKLRDFFFKKDQVHLQYMNEFQVVGTNLVATVRTYQHPRAVNQLVTVIECRAVGHQHHAEVDFSHQVGFRSVWGVTLDNMRSENGKGVALLPHLAKAIYSFYNCTEV